MPIVVCSTGHLQGLCNHNDIRLPEWRVTDIPVYNTCTLL